MSGTTWTIRLSSSKLASLTPAHEGEHQRFAPIIFPDGTELSQYSRADLDKIASRVNERPRETLGFATPADRLLSV